MPYNPPRNNSTGLVDLSKLKRAAANLAQAQQPFSMPKQQPTSPEPEGVQFDEPSFSPSNMQRPRCVLLAVSCPALCEMSRCSCRSHCR